MDWLIQLSRPVLVVLILCSERAGRTSASVADGQRNGFRQSEDASQSYFFYQQSEYPRDCHQALRRCSSVNSSGAYVIKPVGYPEPFEVQCHNSRSSGWTVIQHRVDGSVNFNRSWEDYSDGFGFLSNNYWLGNKKLSYLTNQAVYEIRVDIELSDGSFLYVTHSEFRISDEWDKYKLLTIGAFSFGGSGLVTPCPRNMIYGDCSCGGTCEEPDGSSGCYTGCELGLEGCFCPAGFLMDGDECVPQTECSCFWPGVNAVVPNGQSLVNADCTERRNCTNNQLDNDDGYRCGSDAECSTRDGIRQCYCNEGYEGNGQVCVALYKDCYDVFSAGHEDDGVYTVLPTGWTGDPFNVSCVMSNGGGWTVFQRRTGRNRDVNFYRNWTSYREGFGSLDGDFWLGNEKIHYLTVQGNYKLRVDLISSSNSAQYGEYTTFRTAAERDKYRLSISGHSGSTSDGMYHTNGKEFSTHDSDNDGCGTHNCAAKHRGAWWYTNYYCSYTYNPRCDFFNFGSGSTDNRLCTRSNLNGDYNGGNGQNINWYYNNYCNLNSVEMKIRPLD